MSECKWTQDEDGVWHTACGRSWTFTDSGTLKEHAFNYCHHCGGKVKDEGASDAEL